MKVFCERLKELRLEKKLSCKQLEKDLELGNGTVGKWEKGLRVPSIDNLLLLADYFGVSCDFLLGREN